MTNGILCGKIYGMKAFTNKIKFIYIALLLAFSVICGALSLGFLNVYAENGQTAFEKSLVIPTDKAELFDFDGSSPVDAVNFDGGYAVRTADNKVYVYKEGEYLQISLTQGIPAQIKMLSNDTLLILDGTTLYKVPLSTLTPEPFNYPNTQTAITGSAFDCNGNYIAVRNVNKIFLFALENGQIVEQSNYQIDYDATDLTPLCVDDNGRVHFIRGGNLYTCFGATSNKIYTIEGEIRAIDCHQDQVYFIEYINENLFVKVIVDGKVINLSTTESKYDLGEIFSPAGITLKDDGKILICDSLVGAVQEFSVSLPSNESSQGVLKFTGVAIAKDKTAYNRITNSTTNPAYDIERYGNYTAVFSKDRITVINQDENYTAHNSDSFINLFPQSFGFNANAMPDLFALGNGKIIFAKNFDAPDKAIVKIMDIFTSSVTEISLSIPSVTVHDLCYQSGYFYVLANSSNNTLVFKIAEDDAQEIVSARQSLNLMTTPTFTVDVLGNAHVFSDSTIIKLVTDLKCDLYALKNDGFYKYVQSAWESVASQSNVISFAMSFDSQEVIFLSSADQSIYSTISLNNLAINGTALPQDYLTTGSNANPDGLAFYTVNEGANVYSVKEVNGKFEFVKLTQKEQSYVFICEVPSLSHYALVGQNGVVLVAKSQVALVDQLTDQTLNMQTESKSVFVTTDVNLYYLPIITINDGYVLNASLGGIRLDKGVSLLATKSFNFLGKTFYLVTYLPEDGSPAITGYVPKVFTTDKLSEDYVYTTFTIQTTKGVNVYSHEDMSIKVFTLKDGDSVRLYSTSNGVCKIAYFEQGVWKEGYIKEDAIKDVPNKTIRNVLIVLALTACLCGTVTYFVLRKKED